MGWMFYVRFLPALPSQPPVGPTPCARCLCLTPFTHNLELHIPPPDCSRLPPASFKPAAHPAPYSMLYMFYARSSPCPAPNLHSRALSPAHTLLAPRSPAASRLPTRVPRTAPHVPSFRHSFRLTERIGVRSAAELRHLQRHGHGRHVLRALLPVPCPESAVSPTPARCLPPRSATAPRLPTRIPHAAPYMPSF